MKRVYALFIVLLVTGMSVLSGCSDSRTVTDQNKEIDNHNWTWFNKVKFDVKIDDNQAAYNIYMNLRVTGDYKYANIFVLITTVTPEKKTSVQRYELKLATKEGEWLGKGSGNLYSYQVPFIQGYKFSVKGTYTFYIEQNMRDNPLKEVSDVGLRVEKAQ